MFSSQQHSLTPLVKTLYQHYLGMDVEDHDKSMGFTHMFATLVEFYNENGRKIKNKIIFFIGQCNQSSRQVPFRPPLSLSELDNSAQLTVVFFSVSFIQLGRQIDALYRSVGSLATCAAFSAPLKEASQNCRRRFSPDIFPQPQNVPIQKIFYYQSLSNTSGLHVELAYHFIIS